MNIWLVGIERIYAGDHQYLNSVGGVFEQLLLEGALDLGDDCVRIIVGVAADLVFV